MFPYNLNSTRTGTSGHSSANSIKTTPLKENVDSVCHLDKFIQMQFEYVSACFVEPWGPHEHVHTPFLLSVSVSI